MEIELLNLIASSSLQLAVLNPDTLLPYDYGSGCLVYYKEKILLLSVAHVTDNASKIIAIVTGQPPVAGKSVLYGVGGMCHFTVYTVNPEDLQKGVTDIKTLLSTPKKPLDISFCEIKAKLNLAQEEWDTGFGIVNKGEKIILRLNNAAEPIRNKLYGFYGIIRQGISQPTNGGQPTIKVDLQYRGMTGNMYRFTAPKIISDNNDYKGCSGAPILGEDGEPVALACSVATGTKMMFGFPITECCKLIDKAILAGML